MKRIFVVLAVPLLMGGCASMKTLGTVFVADRLGVPVEAKSVAAKREPTTLVASDHSSCTVSFVKWTKVETGDHVICGWSSTAFSELKGSGWQPSN